MTRRLSPWQWFGIDSLSGENVRCIYFTVGISNSSLKSLELKSKLLVSFPVRAEFLTAPVKATTLKTP